MWKVGFNLPVCCLVLGFFVSDVKPWSYILNSIYNK